MSECPKRCDICQSKIKRQYVDGRTKFGSWGDMCLECFNTFGVGLGVGKGQQYQWDGEKFNKLS